MISYYARYSIKIMSCFFGHNCDVAPLLRLSFGYRRIVGNPSFIAPAILLKVCSQFNLYCLISQTVFNIQGCNCFMEQISEDLRKHCSCRKFSKTQSSIVTNRILDSFQFVSHTWGSSAPLIVIRPKVVLTLVKISIGLFPFTMKDCTLGLTMKDCTLGCTLVLTFSARNVPGLKVFQILTSNWSRFEWEESGYTIVPPTCRKYRRCNLLETPVY